MPARNESFPWMAHYGHYRFFEERMNKHQKVTNIQKIQQGLYNIELIDGRKLKTFICECYSFSIAEYYESIENLGNLDVVIINSNWCGYSWEAKIYCREQKIGLFKIIDFMAALNRTNFWDYLTEYEKKYLKEKGLL